MAVEKSQLAYLYPVVSDPYLDWIRIQSGQADPYPDSESRSRRARMTHKNRKTLKISCFEVLDVLFRGLKVSPVA
jgi:hypothetical protein